MSRSPLRETPRYVVAHNTCSTAPDHEGPNQSFNEIFKGYEAKTGKRLEATYIPVSDLDARLATNPQDLAAFLHKTGATAGPFLQTDNHLYPDWSPSSVLDNIPVE